MEPRSYGGSNRGNIRVMRSNPKGQKNVEAGCWVNHQVCSDLWQREYGPQMRQPSQFLGKFPQRLLCWCWRIWGVWPFSLPLLRGRWWDRDVWGISHLFFYFLHGCARRQRGSYHQSNRCHPCCHSHHKCPGQLRTHKAMQPGEWWRPCTASAQIHLFLPLRLPVSENHLSELSTRVLSHSRARHLKLSWIHFCPFPSLTPPHTQSFRNRWMEVPRCQVDPSHPHCALSQGYFLMN